MCALQAKSPIGVFYVTAFRTQWTAALALLCGCSSYGKGRHVFCHIYWLTNNARTGGLFYKTQLILWKVQKAARKKEFIS